ncbi:MAG TPA: sigma 54-interacting response regulator [Pedobacter sp.]|uniref:sigma 54-interacting response regulator n=1 Tax=Pedobacter sp. TaxID=1411316 RepID=UPI002CBC8948|nr:sigma 54-interacting response regulator [Pedobacter sp.]HMI04058.1 sigma 54-interacting response regulator [Pedobacter sp.]
METVGNSLRYGNKSGFSMKIMIVEDQFIEAHDLQLMLERASYQVCGIARSVEEALKILETEKPELIFLDIILKGNKSGIDLAKILRERNIGFIYISANSNRKILDEAKMTQPYGFIVKPFREQDVLITLEIASYRHNYSQESQIQQQLQIQKELPSILSTENNLVTSLVGLAKVLQTYIPFDYFEAGFVDVGKYNPIGLLRKKIDDYQIITIDKLSEISKLTVLEIQNTHEQSPNENVLCLQSYHNMENIVKSSAIKRLVIQNFGIKSYIVLPLTINNTLFNLSLYSRQQDIQNESHISLLRNLEFILDSFMTKIFVDEVVKVSSEFIPRILTSQLSDIALEEIVGSSQKILQVFDYIKKVSPSDTSVLILGESGTGKEKIAAAIHKMSPRNNKPFVVVDCSTVQQNLAESLLFGHEKGSFTGATDKRLGKFELAEGGTIFLDEIGELPIEIQVKLLRVLQEKEIERVGGSHKIKVDVRIIAATNRHLEEEVSAGRFRMDLYYRLHVFPITVPPLRERKDDIPELANHFIAIYGQSLGKQNAVFSKSAITHLMNYDWGGNIRELEHVVQRSLLLSDDSVIEVADLPSKKECLKKDNEEYAIKTITENERDYIIYILQKCKGKISGASGAAELLDIHPSTLNSKLKKLGIKTHLFS